MTENGGLVRILFAFSIGGEPIYAIVKTGGKQYKVSPGDTIEVERLPWKEGEPLALEHVLLVADGDQVTVGSPEVAGAKVIADVLGEEKGKKVIVFKYKPKVRYRRKLGHRQTHTKLRIREIVVEPLVQDLA